MGGGTGTTETGKIKIKDEISSLIEKAPNSKLCKKILFYLNEHQDFDGFKFDELLGELKSCKKETTRNLDYLRDNRILDKDYFLTYDSKLYVEHIEQQTSKSIQSKSVQKRLKFCKK